MNKLDQSMHMIDTITAFMDSNKKMFSQDIISSDDQIEVEELHRMMEKDRREEANREDLEFMDECREDKMAWDVDESQA